MPSICELDVLQRIGAPAMNDDDRPPSATGRGFVLALLKIGGEVVADRSALSETLAEVARLRSVGWRWVIVHGAGPQAGELQARLGLPSQKIRGLRVTDPETLRVVKQALGGEVNIDLVAAAMGVGLRAVGLSAVSAGMVRARRRAPEPLAGEDPTFLDYGLVGDVERVDPQLLEILLAQGFTPVVSPISLSIGESAGADGVPQVLNVNADTVASELAAALKVDHLFLVTSVPGVLRDKDDWKTRIPRLTATEARRAIAEGVVVGGMIPKVADVLPYLGGEIGAVHIIGAGAESLAKAAAEPGQVGTVLVPDERGARS